MTNFTSLMRMFPFSSGKTRLISSANPVLWIHREKRRVPGFQFFDRDIARELDTCDSSGVQQLRKTALRLAHFNRDAIEQKTVLGNAQYNRAFALGHSFAQLRPRNVELRLRAPVIKTVQAHVFHKNIKAVKKRTRRRLSGCTCAGARNRRLRISSLAKAKAKGTTMHVTEVTALTQQGRAGCEAVEGKRGSRRGNQSSNPCGKRNVVTVWQGSIDVGSEQSWAARGAGAPTRTL